MSAQFVPPAHESTAVLWERIVADGKCAHYPQQFLASTEPWVPELQRGPKSLGRQRQHAYRVCSRCPVIQSCREYALRREQRTGVDPFAVWGSMPPADRREALDTRQRQQESSEAGEARGHAA